VGVGPALSTRYLGNKERLHAEVVDRDCDLAPRLDSDLTAAERDVLRAGRPGRAPWDRVPA